MKRLNKLGLFCAFLIAFGATAVACAGAVCSGAGALGAMLVTAACGRTFSFALRGSYGGCSGVSTNV